MATQTMTETTTDMMRRRFTVADYYRMAEAGILTEDDRVELIVGEIIQMSPIGVRHARCVNRLTLILSRCVEPGMLLGVQNPIRLADDTEPQPDLAIAYDHEPGDAHPTGAEVLLVIEVADSSRGHDRGTKFPLYAAAGIGEAWLVDLVAKSVERYTEPHEGRYGQVAHAESGQTLASTVLPALVIPVADILK